MTVAAVAGVRAEALQESETAAWRDALSLSTNATFYHDAGFSAIYAYKTTRVTHLWFRSSRRIVGQLAGGSTTDEPQVFKTPFSSSFGGIAVARELTLAEAVGLVDAFVDWARASRFLRIEVQQPPAIYAERVDDTIEFALRRAGFRQTATELCLYVDSLDRLDDTLKRNVRKAEQAGCIVRRTPDRDGVWQFLSEMKRRKEQPFNIGRDDFGRLCDTFPGGVQCFEVMNDGQRIAALIAYRLNSRVTLGFQWGHVEEAQDVRPADLLLHGAVQAAFAAGCRVFDFGTTTLQGEPSWGVTQFKTKFGTFGVERRRMVLTLAEEY